MPTGTGSPGMNGAGKGNSAGIQLGQMNLKVK
jgi:hypothetical protein